MSSAPEAVWHPIARNDDAPPRHVYRGQLHGHELAVWRADDGHVNVWRNQCLHRGVRLTIGTNDGRELVCRYHGWRYANRTGGCTYIPAHPADAPARTICAQVFPAMERYGMVWTALAAGAEPPTVASLESGSPFPVRHLPVDAPAEMVLQWLHSHRFRPSGTLAGDVDGTEVTIVGGDDRSVELLSEAGPHRSRLVCFVQPVDASRCVVRGVLDTAPPPADRLPTLRHHALRLSGLRDRVESEARRAPPVSANPPPEISIEPLHAPEPGIDDAATPAPGRHAPLRLRVAAKWSAAADVAGFALEPIAEPLPTFQPGAHIDVHLPNGLVRQYSLVNGPDETTRYVIGVKLEPQSEGGSSCLHDVVREGDVLAVSEPRNNFPLRRDAVRTVLVAGGIGVTPLLSMVQTLDHMNLAYELHIFARGQEHIAFAEIVDELSAPAVLHLGLSPDATGQALAGVVAGYESAHHLYVCGPAPLIEATRQQAAGAGWPDEAVHFEYFSNPTDVDDSSTFEVSLARSALDLAVPSGRTILEVLRENGVTVPSSCEQGACGTCLTAVLGGEPDHQDVYLNDSEKRAGDRMMICVSRARSDRLVLDV